MKITDKRNDKPTKFEDVKVGDVFCIEVSSNIFMKISYGYNPTDMNAFCLNRNELCRLKPEHEISLLDTELVINN